MAWQIGVDVGGTFTDLLALDPERGVFRVAKVPSTPEDQSVGFIAGLAVLETDLAAVAALVHGTTVATNAVLERKGARCGLITTAGFRDVLELGRRTRPNPYGMTGSFEALIPRDLRAEVPERIDAAGRVLTPLDEAAVRREVHRLRERGAEALVIHFIHAYANPAHEQRCGEIAREIWPNRFVTLGSDILREVREFERGSTAALNGYVQPIVSRYLGRLSQNLRSAGLSNELLVMQGNGGMMAAGMAIDLAVHTVMSGPAAGAIAAARIGVQAGHPNLVACDMGGTSFDVSLIAAGEPALSAEKDIAYGVPLRVPLVDIHTIGAGGGSIARITRAGLLQVGPESAGARPGPIAYGRGGTAVTVTDANLVLGRLNPDRLTGVAAGAPMERIAAAIEEQIGVPLGLDADRRRGGGPGRHHQSAGACDPPGFGREGARSARLRPLRFWRRRSVARRRNRPRARHSDRAGAAFSGHHLGSGLRPRAGAARFCPEHRPAARRCGDSTDRRPLRRSGCGRTAASRPRRSAAGRNRGSPRSRPPVPRPKSRLSGAGDGAGF